MISDVTMRSDMTLLTTGDRLVKTSQTEKGRTVSRMTVDPVGQWKWCRLFDLVQRIDSTGNARRLSGSGLRPSE